MNTYITTLQAFNALIIFLENYNEKHFSDDLCDLLSGTSMDIWADGGTADPAYWDEWVEVIKKVTKLDTDTLTTRESFEASKEFLKLYFADTNSKDIQKLLEYMENTSSLQDSWNHWTQSAL
jgi:hypothetical protein